MIEKPTKVAIEPDDYSACEVGRTADGRQFFLTNPFVPASSLPGREFLALYLFDEQGSLLQAQIVDLGTREALDHQAAEQEQLALLASLGEIRQARIEVVPFAVERFGLAFGLIPQPPEEEDEDWCVIAEPGNYMCFWPPYTSGDYDT